MEKYDKKKYNIKYTKENYKHIKLQLHKEYEKDMIDFLSGIDNVNQFLKDLIDTYMREIRKTKK